MPPFLAIFMSIEGAPLSTGLFTFDEFDARYAAARQRTLWATLLDSKTGKLIRRYDNTKENEEKTA